MSSTTSTPTLLICSECGMGHYQATTAAAAACTSPFCTHVVGIRNDVEPFLEDNERLIVDARGRLATITT